MGAPRHQALRVGIDHAPPIPMQMGTPEDGSFRGYEVSLLDELATRLARTITYRRAFWSALVQELTDGKIDIICSAATITPERLRIVDFCQPHLQLKLAAVMRISPSLHEIDWTNLRSGVRAGTTAEEWLSRRQVNPAMRSESNDTLYTALADGILDVVVDDSPIALHFSQAIAGLHYAGPLPGPVSTYGIMVRKGDSLLEAINQHLADMEADSTLPDLRRQTFGTDHLLVA